LGRRPRADFRNEGTDRSPTATATSTPSGRRQYRVHVKWFDEHGDGNFRDLFVTVNNVAPTVEAGGDAPSAGRSLRPAGSSAIQACATYGSRPWTTATAAAVQPLSLNPPGIPSHHRYSEPGAYLVTVTVATRTARGHRQLPGSCLQGQQACQVELEASSRLRDVTKDSTSATSCAGWTASFMELIVPSNERVESRAHKHSIPAICLDHEDESEGLLRALHADQPIESFMDIPFGSRATKSANSTAARAKSSVVPSIADGRTLDAARASSDAAQSRKRPSRFCVPRQQWRDGFVMAGIWTIMVAGSCVFFLKSTVRVWADYLWLELKRTSNAKSVQVLCRTTFATLSWYRTSMPGPRANFISHIASAITSNVEGSQSLGHWTCCVMIWTLQTSFLSWTRCSVRDFVAKLVRRSTT